MYLFYFDDVVLPITPSSLKIKINNQNNTITLINEGEVNLLKTAGLTEISFKFLIPQSTYPFTNSGARSADYYLDMLEKRKLSQKPFRFIVTREKTTRKLFDTNMEVSLEDYTIEEDVKHGFDLSISVSLKQYRPYGTKIAKIKEQSSVSGSTRPSNIVIKSETSRPASTIATNVKPYIGCTCTVNGVLHRDSYGNAPGQTRTNYQGKINFINTRGSHPYHITSMTGGYQGWVLASAVSNVK